MPGARPLPLTLLEPKPLDPPPSPFQLPPTLLKPSPLVYPPVLRWVPPPHPTGHPSKNDIFPLLAPSTRHIQGHVGCSECRDCRELVKRRGVPEFSWLRTLTRVFSTIRADIKAWKMSCGPLPPNATKRPKQDFFFIMWCPRHHPASKRL